MTSLKIGTIRAGNIDAGLVRKLGGVGHEVALANSKGPDTVRNLARDAGATTASKEAAVQGLIGIAFSIAVRKVL